MLHHQKNNSLAFTSAHKALEVLENSGFQARFVGGCVRDRLLGLEPKDYDIATNASPEKVLEIFSDRPFKSIPTGLDHGTITVIYRRQTIEITSLRKDMTTDGRRATVVFGNSFEDDAARRDFTINAMYEDSIGNIYDYFEGKKHLKEKKIIFVGETQKRIREDYLRILRFFRFKCRFNLQADSKSLEAIKDLSSGLNQISIERINSEISSIFSFKELGDIASEMDSCSIFDYLFNELNISQLKHKNLLFACLHSLGESIEQNFLSQSRIALLIFWQQFYGERKLPKKEILLFLNKQKFSNSLSKIIYFAVSGLDFLPHKNTSTAEKLAFIDTCESESGQKNIFKEFYYPFWSYLIANIENYDHKSKSNLCEIFEVEKNLGHRRKSPSFLNGQKVMQHFQLSEGERLGKLLCYLKEDYRNNSWSTWDEAKDIIEDYLKNEV